jgi:hypothetical protein
MAIIVHKQKVRPDINHKKSGGRVKGFGNSAAGDAANNGMPVTPAPVRPVAPDVVTHPRQPIGASYGMSGGSENPSSIPPGSTLQSSLATNLRASVDDDGLLDRIQRLGSSRGVINDVDLMSPQTREVDATPLKASHGMRSRTANQEGGKVPTKTG